MKVFLKMLVLFNGFWGLISFSIFRGPVLAPSLFEGLTFSESCFRSETQFKKQRDVFVYISASGCPKNPWFSKWVDNLFIFYEESPVFNLSHFFHSLIVRTGRTRLSAIELTRRDETILNVCEASHRTC